LSAEQLPDVPSVTGEEKRRRRVVPRGAIVLGLLLYAGALVSMATGLVLETADLAGVPRWVPLLGALVLAVLATGLFRRRRWAWFSMLAFVGVSAYYLLRATAERGQNTAIGLTLLAVIAGYLLWPGVRAVYLRGDPVR
jgi:uncharacterized membrane protein